MSRLVVTSWVANRTVYGDEVRVDKVEIDVFDAISPEKLEQLKRLSGEVTRKMKDCQYPAEHSAHVTRLVTSLQSAITGVEKGEPHSAVAGHLQQVRDISLGLYGVCACIDEISDTVGPLLVALLF